MHVHYVVLNPQNFGHSLRFFTPSPRQRRTALHWVSCIAIRGRDEFDSVSFLGPEGGASGGFDLAIVGMCTKRDDP
ncbi:MAG: hypothetical protein JWO80_4564, partial [Bryobacterales bacterium]|nr:hypothetical protein [Bryobacterales bacterium]